MAKALLEEIPRVLDLFDVELSSRRYGREDVLQLDPGCWVSVFDGVGLYSPSGFKRRRKQGAEVSVGGEEVRKEEGKKGRRGRDEPWPRCRPIVPHPCGVPLVQRLFPRFSDLIDGRGIDVLLSEPFEELF